jgi:hypothetical protein
MLGHILFAAFAITVYFLPFLLWGFEDTSTDLHITILSRILSSRLLWHHGIYNRVPELLSGMDPWSSGLFSLKVDSLFMDIITSSHSVMVLLVFRIIIFTGLTSLVLQGLYRAPFRLSIALALCAAAGVNILNWLYYGPDYVGGGAAALGYIMFPLLLIPMVLEKRIKSTIAIASAAFLIGASYGSLALFFIAVFGCYVAGVWTVVQVGSLRGLAIAAALSTGVAITIAPEIYRFMQIGAEGGLRNTFAELFDLKETLRILVHRDFGVTLVCTALATTAIIMAHRNRGDVIALIKLAVVYALCMLLDPIVKSLGNMLLDKVPVVVLSASYYTYVFAPVVFAAFLCVGFKNSTGITKECLPIVLLGLSFVITLNGVRDYNTRAVPDLSVDIELANVLKARAAKKQRAVVVRETEDDLEKSARRLPRLSPNHFAAFGLYMADGYVSNPDANYAIFMTNAAAPADAAASTKSSFQRNIVLNVPVSSHLREGAGNCLKQDSPIALDDHLLLPVLQNAAVQYVISMYRLESKYLAVYMPENPLFCAEGRSAGRPYVYEFIEPATRFGLAHDIAFVKSLSEVYELIRSDPEFGRSNRAALLEQEANKLHGPVIGVAVGEGNVELVADDGDLLKLNVSSPTDALLLIRDSYSQPVFATTEGNRLDVVRVNGAFIGVRVPPGTHRVDVAFR